MQRSPHKTNIFKGQAASRMHYAKFYDIFSEDLNSTDAQYFIENAASYPTAPSYKLDWGETNPKS